MKHKVLTAGAVLLLTGCASVMDEQAGVESPEEFFQPVEQEIDPVAPMVLRVVGYGATNESSEQSATQKRLMAIRASKLDAYRAMAERVYGTSIQGSTSVSDMVVQNDRFRTYVETSIHGARVVSTEFMADGSVETILEMTIDQGFRNCLQTRDSQRFNVDCRVPLGARSVQHFAASQRDRVESESGSPESGFYFIE
ncbi:MAG: hypothetical protein CMI00_13050 [Oceanospirillaceae bacterium]|nr:hypothetical protein [Oceanospirillaceae bacterium]MAR01451.1 hypothetical protein [Oceanospirillaceae bacterium]|tara:strand:+ start:752 stop:1342 length:591 start_codon:yes stop_codon:yes gene_type:complete